MRLLMVVLDYAIQRVQLSFVCQGFIIFHCVPMQNTFEQVDNWLEMQIEESPLLVRTPSLDIFAELLEQRPPLPQIGEALSTSESIDPSSSPIDPISTPPSPPLSPSKRRSSKKQPKEGMRKGHWTSHQNQLYHWFLEVHAQHFLHSQMRRTDKIFKTMERFVGTREAQQCRSHHQKMEKKHGSFRKILGELRRLINGCVDSEPVATELAQNGIEWENKLLSGAQLVRESSVGGSLKEQDMEVRMREEEGELKGVQDLSRQSSYWSQLLQL